MFDSHMLNSWLVLLCIESRYIGSSANGHKIELLQLTNSVLSRFRLLVVRRLIIAALVFHRGQGKLVSLVFQV